MKFMIAIPFLGPPGSGKGTQAELLCKRYNGKHIIVGDLVREVANNPKDEFGLKVRERYEQGIPQPDEIINELVRRKLSELDFSKYKFIALDPYPISMGQVYALEEIRKEFNFERLIVLYIKVSEKEAVKRLTLRKRCPKCKEVFYPLKEGYKEGICPKCKVELIRRVDDTKEVATKRYRIYDERMKEIIEFYKKRDELIEINGEQTVEEVHNEIIEKLKSVLGI